MEKMSRINTKIEKINFKQNPNSKYQKKYDLEERTIIFANRLNGFVNKLPYSISNNINWKPLARAEGSIVANYIEPNEALSKNDFRMRIIISKKESKKTRYWLRLSNPIEDEIDEKNELIQGSTEITKILG
jgi:four helix bundle protein